MFKYIFLLLFAGLATASGLNAQNNETIKKAIENPKAKEDAAKADARLIDQKKLTTTDSVATSTKTMKKKKHCRLRKKAKTL